MTPTYPGGDFYNSSGTAYADWEWSGNDRLDDPYHRQGNSCYGNNSYDAEFNGLDYMFLFSLFSLEEGGSYLQGMMNPYYCKNYSIDYPDASDYGSFTNELKLNWLEYISAIDKIHSGSSSSTDGWVDFRAAKVIDLKPGFWAQKGSFFLAHIKDYNCNGGNYGDGPYHFAELNPPTWALMPVRNPDSLVDTITATTHTGFYPIEYFPNGPGYVPEKLPDADPMANVMDSVMTPQVRSAYAQYLMYAIVNTVKDTNEMAIIKQHYHWNDDTIAKYTIPVPDTILAEVYPNPTASSSTLSYSMSKPSAVFIKLTNAIGDDFSNLIEHYDENEEAGQHKVLIHSEQLVPGMYIVTMRVGGQTVARKLSVAN